MKSTANGSLKNNFHPEPFIQAILFYFTSVLRRKFVFVFWREPQRRWIEERAEHFFPLFSHKQLSQLDGTAKNIRLEEKFVDNNVINVVKVASIPQ